MDNPTSVTVRGEEKTFPFEIETKKHGRVTVLAVERTDKGGLAQIEDSGFPSWVRASEVLGQEFWR